MTEYLCLTLVAPAGEDERVFKSSLTTFWTYLIRTHPDTYESVYAEATHFDATNGRVSRRYMVEADAADEVVAALTAAGLESLPLEPDDTYTKYEAGGSDWFQIPH